MDDSSTRSAGPARRSVKKSQQGQQAQQAQQFMFIDSSNKGVNSKPDKDVRSFVMKSARNRKTWSTRKPEQKAANVDQDVKLESDVKSESTSSPTSSDHGSSSPTAPITHSPTWQHAAASPVTLSNNPPAKASPYPSPVRSKRTALFTRSRSKPYISLASSTCYRCRNLECTGDPCSQPQPSLQMVSRVGYTVGFVRDFDCLPVPSNNETKELLFHFVHTISRSLITLDQHSISKPQIERWIWTGIQSPTGAPFLNTIYTSSARYCPFPYISPGDTLYYKTSAIAEINKQLQDNEKCVNDDNITAVFMLLCIEEGEVTANEDVENASKQRQVHLNGLKAMINQRGGLASLHSNQCLQTFILMHSVTHAVSTFERPYTTLVDTAGHIQQYDIPSFRDRPSPAQFLRFFRPLRLDDSLYHIITDIVVFTGDLNAWNNDAKVSLDAIEMQKHICLLLYRLFDWQKLHEEDPALERSPIDRSICLALIIFLNAAHNPNYTFANMLYATSQRLQNALRECCSKAWEQVPDLQMWTLSLGGLATRYTDEFGFFTNRCVAAFEAQGFVAETNPEEVLDRLRKFIWLGKLDADIKDMWLEMGICKGEEAQETTPTTQKSPSPDRTIKKEDIVGGLTNERFNVKSS